MIILDFLRELKASHNSIADILMEGSCFRLCRMLKLMDLAAEFYYSEIDGHWITCIDGRFYDINGELDKRYVEERGYRHVEDKVTLESAYVPTYKGQSCSYSKYIKTV